METYQAVYDAVRSRFGNIDSSVLIDKIVQCFDFSCQLSTMFQNIEYENVRPSAIQRPKLSIDGDQWCALYGDNLQEGVVGFGDSPAKAMQEFDNNWHKKLKDK